MQLLLQLMLYHYACSFILISNTNLYRHHKYDVKMLTKSDPVAVVGAGAINLKLLSENEYDIINCSILSCIITLQLRVLKL
jgi:hypothetical protein